MYRLDAFGRSVLFHVLVGMVFILLSGIAWAQFEGYEPADDLLHNDLSGSERVSLYVRFIWEASS